MVNSKVNNPKLERVEFTIKAKLLGFQKEGETEQEAKVRLALAAENRVNAMGDVRMHVSVPEAKNGSN